jgi:hypothetical protein
MCQTLDMSQCTKNVYHIHMFIVMSGKHTGKEVYLKFLVLETV